MHTENFLGVELTFALSHWVIESSRIKYLQNSRPESFWYYSTILYNTHIYIYIWRDTVKNSWVKKRVYKRVIYYFPSRWKIIYLIVFYIDIFVSPCVYKLIIYIFSSVRQHFTKTFSSARDSNPGQSLDAMHAVMNLSSGLPMQVCKGAFLGSLNFTEVVHSVFLIFYNINFHIF